MTHLLLLMIDPGTFDINQVRASRGALRYPTHGLIPVYEHLANSANI